MKKCPSIVNITFNKKSIEGINRIKELHDLYFKADEGSTRSATDSITAIINKDTSSYAKRHEHLKFIITKKVFKDVF